MWRVGSLLMLAACGSVNAQRSDLPQKVKSDTAQVVRYGVDISLLAGTGHVVACYVTRKGKPPALACVAVPVARPIDR